MLILSDAWSISQLQVAAGLLRDAQSAGATIESLLQVIEARVKSSVPAAGRSNQQSFIEQCPTPGCPGPWLPCPVSSKLVGAQVMSCRHCGLSRIVELR